MADSTKKKTFISGSAKERLFDNGGEVINLSLNLGQLSKIVDDKGYVRITLQKLKEADRYGNSHSIYEDTFRPTNKGAATPKAPSPVQAKQQSGSDDFPF